MGRNLALPPSHLLRQVFETARDYRRRQDHAVRDADRRTRHFRPCGMHSSEGCVIERTEDAFAVREMADGHVCATNHFESPLNEAGMAGGRARSTATAA